MRLFDPDCTLARFGRFLEAWGALKGGGSNIKKGRFLEGFLGDDITWET